MCLTPLSCRRRRNLKSSFVFHHTKIEFFSSVRSRSRNFDHSVPFNPFLSICFPLEEYTINIDFRIHDITAFACHLPRRRRRHPRSGLLRFHKTSPGSVLWCRPRKLWPREGRIVVRRRRDGLFALFVGTLPTLARPGLLVRIRSGHRDHGCCGDWPPH